jgi:hypothetical protein
MNTGFLPMGTARSLRGSIPRRITRLPPQTGQRNLWLSWWILKIIAPFSNRVLTYL